MRFTLVLISIFASVSGQEKPSLEEIEEARRLGKIRKDWSIKDGINKIQNPVAAAGELIEKILDEHLPVHCFQGSPQSTLLLLFHQGTHLIFLI